MVVGKPIWEIIKGVERIGSIVKIRIHLAKVMDKKNGELIDFRFSQPLLKSDVHVLFFAQGIKCNKRDKIEVRVQESLSKGDYYEVDLIYDTDLDKEHNEHYKNMLTLLV